MMIVRMIVIIYIFGHDDERRIRKEKPGVFCKENGVAGGRLRALHPEGCLAVPQQAL